MPLTANAALPLILPPAFKVRFKVPAVLPIAALTMIFLSAIKVSVGLPVAVVLLIATAT